MKTRYLFILAALAGVAYAGPPPLTSGIPSFLDTDGDGRISLEEREAFIELRKEARGGGAPDLDLDGDGAIDGLERAAAVAAIQAKMNAKRAELFTKIAGADEVLTLADFSALTPFANVPPLIVAALFDLLDIDGDNEVTLAEFLAGIRGSVPTPPTPPTPPSLPSPPSP
jgi:hypothetical protein